MNEAQRLAIKKLDQPAWVVDTNFYGEPIIYTHTEKSPVVKEFVIDKQGVAFQTQTYPWTTLLMKELRGYI
jgi:hypothetical protein